MSNLLTATDVQVRYGALHAVRGASLQVPRTGIHGLIGPNGSGKSSLLKSIAGATAARFGVLTLDGQKIDHWSAHRRARAGIVLKFQIPRVFRSLTVRENLSIVHGITRSGSASADHQWLDDFAEKLGLFAANSALAGSLSHGQQHWLEILMCLHLAPRLLLLDEPTAGLGPEERAITGELIRTAARSCSVVIVEHDLAFVRLLADRVTVLREGEVVAELQTSEIEKNPVVHQIFLGSYAERATA
jgi:ABC-type uncharacterized transport system ATPase subunit